MERNEKYLSPDGGTIELGDIIEYSGFIDTPLGKTHITQRTMVTKDNVEGLLGAGIIKRAGCRKNISAIKDVADAIEAFAKRQNWTYNKAEGYLNNLYEIYPTAALSILLMEVAISIDRKYPDPIENSKDIYTISLINGKITKVNKGQIKTYRNFAAFRTIEDAKETCSVFSSTLRNMFHGSGK